MVGLCWEQIHSDLISICAQIGHNKGRPRDRSIFRRYSTRFVHRLGTERLGFGEAGSVRVLSAPFYRVLMRYQREDYAPHLGPQNGGV